MFSKTLGKPTKFKKTIYLLATIILGLLLSVLVHALIEIQYILRALRHSYIVPFYGGCALPPLLRTMLWIDGAVGGGWLGLYWWKKIYIQRAWTNKQLTHRKKL
jgi:hypothetical protein